MPKKNSPSGKYWQESSSDEEDKQGCSCGCPCPRIPGKCGIVLKDGKPVCHCDSCGGTCGGLCASSDPELHDSEIYCEDCYRKDMDDCVLCVCCAQIHNSKGDLMTKDDLECYDSERDDEEKLTAKRKAESKAKRDAKRDAKKAKTETARQKRVDAKEAKQVPRVAAVTVDLTLSSDEDVGV